MEAKLETVQAMQVNGSCFPSEMSSGVIAVLINHNFWFVKLYINTISYAHIYKWKTFKIAVKLSRSGLSIVRMCNV